MRLRLWFLGMGRKWEGSLDQEAKCHLMILKLDIVGIEMLDFVMLDFDG